MTKREYNAKIARLFRDYKAWLGMPNISWADAKACDNVREDICQRLNILWNVDPELEYVTLLSLKRLLVLNQSLRVIQLHHLASRITL